MLTLIYSPEFLEHDNGSMHPERAERLRAIVEALYKSSWTEQLNWQLPTPVTEREGIVLIEKLHAPDYLKRVQKIAVSGGGMIDLDTPISPRSYDVALLAVSAWLDGVDVVLATAEPAFILARPPGHHATRKTGMGFCLFSNAAIAAHYALEKPGIERVGILDWDVHHGNGTQDLVENNPQIAYCSLHQFPCYPGTGKETERGKHHNVLNIPMMAGSTLAQYELAFAQQVMPFYQEFAPDLLIISAGYDANEADPLASISLQPQDYGVFSNYCLQLGCPLLFGLEGGYDLDALAESVMATIASCLHTN